MKVYHGNSDKRELIGTCKTQKEAYDLIERHIKDNNKFESFVFSFWHENGELVVDYGMHNTFYYVNFEEENNDTEV